jgi:4-amino-4-deoxy-L-arabinose transferase-like glycosyltransferase
MKTTADITALHEEGTSKADPRSLPALALPERIPAEWAIVVVAFVLATAYLLLFRRIGLVPDEGTILQGAQRVLDGQVPYRDFFSLYTPGSFYFLALLFKIFGDSIIVARTVVTVYGGLFAVLTYLIARGVCGRWSALLTAYMVTVVVPAYGLFAVHNWDSTLWAYLALFCAVWFLRRPHWGWALGMGTCCSLTGLFEQSKGAGLLLGLAVGFAILWACRQIHLRRSQIIAALAGLVWPAAIAMAYLAAQHALPQVMKDMLHPLLHYSAVNRVPYGYMVWGDETRSMILSGSWLTTAFILYVVSPLFLLSALPIFGAGILVYSSVQTWKMRPAQAERWSYFVLVSACTTGLLLCVLVTRKDITHFVYIAPLLCLILSWFLDGSDIRLRTVDQVRPLVVAAVVLAFSLLGVSTLMKAHGSAARETRRGVLRVPPSETALDYLRMHTRPGEEIFIYPYYPTYYYLSATSNPTPYDFMQPGYNTPQQFQEALNIISVRRPRVVLLQSSSHGSSFYGVMLQTFPSTPIRVLVSRDPVADFIFREYRSCAILVPANFGGLAFMVRKESPCPAGSAREPAPTNR